MAWGDFRRQAVYHRAAKSGRNGPRSDHYHLMPLFNAHWKQWKVPMCSYIMVQINSLPRSTCTAEPPMRQEKKLRLWSSNHKMETSTDARGGCKCPLDLLRTALSSHGPTTTVEVNTKGQPQPPTRAAGRAAAPTSLPLAVVFWHGTSDFIWIEEGRLATPAAAEDSGIDVDPKSGG